MGVSENRGKPSKMDGENTWKPYFFNGMILGGKPTIFGNIHPHGIFLKGKNPIQLQSIEIERSWAWCPDAGCVFSTWVSFGLFVKEGWGETVWKKVFLGKFCKKPHKIFDMTYLRLPTWSYIF